MTEDNFIEAEGLDAANKVDLNKYRFIKEHFIGGVIVRSFMIRKEYLK